MKNWYFYLISLLLSCSIMACSDSDNNPAAIVIAKEQQNLTIAASDTEKTIQFTTTGAWYTEITYTESKAAAVESWITLDPSKGEAGEVTIRMGLTANTEKAERKARIKIICGETVVTVEVKQEGETSGEEDPTPLAKKRVSSVEIRSVDHSAGSVQEDKLLYSFKYDELGRLTEQCLKDKEGEEYIHRLMYTAEGIQVTEAGLNSETWMVSVNEKGAAEKLEVRGTYGGYGDQTYSFSYDVAGHLTSETWKRDDTECFIDYSWENGNLASVVYRYSRDEPNLRDTLANGYSYRNSPVNNLLNIDPNLFVSTLEARDGSANSNQYYPRKGRMDLLALWGLLGKRSEGYIAQSMDEYESGAYNPEDEFYYDYQRTYYPFSYEFDEEGYLLSITDKTDVKIYKVKTGTEERTLMKEVTDQVVYAFNYKN